MATILFVDDDEALHPLVGSVLRAEMHDLVTAADPRKACALIREQAFDLIILDHDMPQMTGIEVLRQIKAEAVSLPPVIMLTARGEKETVRAYIEAGARDFIVKPFDAAELARRVKKHLPEEQGEG